MMNNKAKQWISFFLCIVLIAAMALTCTGCGVGETDSPKTTKTFTDGETLGEGASSFTLIVTDGEGKSAKATVHTDETLVGEALLELGLIAGEQQAVGLYIKTVNGMTYDYEKDGKYWAFYIDGEYAMTGVDSTEIQPNCTYELRAES